ncbi:MAG: HAEPLYID family protein [Salibacteraceae bacterium]
MFLTPFLIAAKRWGTNFHTLIYTGPVFHQNLDTKNWHNSYELNFSTHYMISGTNNFIGIEFNQQYVGSDFDMTIRPQMRVAIAHNFLVGLLFGIPVERENERFSSFVRLIWEPEGFLNRN